MNLNIVLFEPQIPQNTGNIVRTCAAVGANLHIVYPIGFKINDKAVKRAGLDYWDLVNIFYYDNTEDFFNKNKNKNFYFFTTKTKTRYSDIKYKEESFLIFGREDRGINVEILNKYKDYLINIPMKDDIRSLNLSNSVAIAVYEYLRQFNFFNIV